MIADRVVFNLTGLVFNVLSRGKRWSDLNVWTDRSPNERSKALEHFERFERFSDKMEGSQ